VRDHLGRIVRGTVEETLRLRSGQALNKRTEARQDQRPGSYDRKLQTKGGEVRLKMPKLRRQALLTEIATSRDMLRTSPAQLRLSTMPSR
jgi:putative transposase